MTVATKNPVTLLDPLIRVSHHDLVVMLQPRGIKRVFGPLRHNQAEDRLRPQIKETNRDDY